jgi:molybdopterin molybdotransferase
VPELISISEAQRRVIERVKPLEAERVPIERAAGRVLADPAVAVVDLPPFPSSAMDGYALRSADTAAAPLTLPVVARIPAGAPATRCSAPVSSSVRARLARWARRASRRSGVRSGLAWGSS